MKVVIFVHSLAYAHHPGRQVHNTNPYYGMAVEQTFVEAMDWDARLFSDEDRKILDALGALTETQLRAVSIVDVARPGGRLRAWWSGVFFTPAALIERKRYRGYPAVISILAAWHASAAG